MPVQLKHCEQTLTVMEAAITVVPGKEEELHKVHSKLVPVAARQPGYLWYGGGPIENSAWTYFSAKFETPAAMEEWYRHPRHEPVKKLGFDRWFSTMYIRKWRLPGDGEKLGDRIFCETIIRAPRPIENESMTVLKATVDAELALVDPMPFETLTGHFESQKYQIVGPLDEAPAERSTNYLLLTHWSATEDLTKWLDSRLRDLLCRYGEISTSMFMPVPEIPGSRPGLRADGLQRDWVAASSTRAHGSEESPTAATSH